MIIRNSTNQTQFQKNRLHQVIRQKILNFTTELFYNVLFTRDSFALIAKELRNADPNGNGLRMFFKPNFCCGCGEKITRAEWGILTSRRFCDVCAVENQGYEWFPRLIVVSAVLIGFFGFGSYLRSGESPAPVTLKKANPLNTAQGSGAALRPVGDSREPEVQNGVANDIPGGSQEVPVNGGERGASKQQTLPLSGASDEPVYFCEAMTKKGKPCSRRVKTKGRCWQHVGRPSALASHNESEVY